VRLLVQQVLGVQQQQEQGVLQVRVLRVQQLRERVQQQQGQQLRVQLQHHAA
jgi:hypothetical protein